MIVARFFLVIGSDDLVIGSNDLVIWKGESL